MVYFILGSHPELSVAELKAVLGEVYSPVFISESVVAIEALDHRLDELQERLAGVVKIGHVLGEQAIWQADEVADLIALFAATAGGKMKISFGLSVYDAGDAKSTRLLERELDQLGLEIKKRLKQAGRPVRYVKGKSPRLSSAIVETNGLLESGGEFVLLAAPDRIAIGQTETIQNFKAWSSRDYGRPARDAKAGMLPPKLARLMINLSGIDPYGATLLDPFCGSGTVLMEGALMGCTQLIGSDLSEKAVANTQTNMSWLTDRFELAQVQLSLYVSRAAELTSTLPLPKGETEGVAGLVDLLVTEVYLGSPRTSAVDSQEAHRLEAELLPLYHDSFAALKTLLKPDGRAVVAFPAYKTKEDGWHRLPLKSLLEDLGYDILDNHLYSRAGQLVARDIYVLSH